MFFLVLLDLDFEIQPFSLCPSLDDILQLAAFRFSTCFGQVGFQHFHFPFQQLLCSVLSSLRTSCVWFLTNFCLSGKKALVAPFSRPRALVHCLVFCCLAIFSSPLFCLPGTTIDDNAWRSARRRPPIGGCEGGRGLRRVAEGAACLSEGPVTRSPDLLSPVLVRPACSAADTGLKAQVLTTTELALAESATVALHWKH